MKFCVGKCRDIDDVNLLSFLKKQSLDRKLLLFTSFIGHFH